MIKGISQPLFSENAIKLLGETPQLKFVTLMMGHGDRHHTKGKRAYFKDGKLMDPKLSVEYREEHCDEAFYEGESNRLIGMHLIAMLRKAGIPFAVVNKGNDDMSRTKRCRIADQHAKKHGVKHTLNIAIHSDAVDNPKAHGCSCYTSPNFTMSDVYATSWYKHAKVMWPNETFREGRAHGLPGKEAKFTVLTDTASPSILPEFFFFTNYKDYSTHLKTVEGRTKCAQVLFNMIKEFYIAA